MKWQKVFIGILLGVWAIAGAAQTKEVKRLMARAERGEARAQYILGNNYYFGKGILKSSAEAIKWYEKSAQQGYVPAQLVLGHCYLHGEGVAKDAEKAVQWFEKSAQQGDADGQLYLGNCYYEGAGTARNYEKAVEWYQKAAEQGHPKAQTYLGECYLYGEGVTKDVARAAHYFQQGAAQGNVLAQNQLAVCYFFGRGLPEDHAKAAEWFLKSAERGDAIAQYNVAQMYYNGDGVEKNSKKAADWYAKSAAQGYAASMNAMGVLCMSGDGVEKNVMKAAEWFEKSAELGHVQGQFNAAMCYEYGDGVDSDEAVAILWYRKAAAQGHEQAKKRLAQLGAPYKENTTPAGGERPRMTWLDFLSQTEEGNQTFRVGIKSDSKLSATSFELNGSPLRGINAVTNDQFDFMISQRVTLHEGENKIKVTATNNSGTTTEERTVTYRKPQGGSVDAGRRLALIVGNADYASQRLENPANDAQDISAKLKTLGFETLLVLNKNKRGLEDAIREFSARAKDYETAVFYYAGHGIQCAGRNYLVPVDAELKSESDVEYDCTDANRVLSALEESGCPLKIMILDACRNNPFERSWRLSRGGDASRGLVQMNAPAGTVIAYATSPGSVAQDGEGRNSPYAAALLRTLEEPNLPLFEFFNEVATQVYDNTGEQQVPWNTNSPLRGKFYFNPQ